MRGLPKASRPFLVAMAVLAFVSVVASVSVLVSSFRTRRRMERNVSALQRQLDTSHRAARSLEARIAAEKRRMEEVDRKAHEEARAETAALSGDAVRLERELAEARSDASTRRSEIAALERRLVEARRQLEDVRAMASLPERLIREMQGSVCLVEATVAWGPPEPRDAGPAGAAATPQVVFVSFGTGFLASRSGRVVTNRHVVEPWWRDSDSVALRSRGLVPRLVSLRAWFPGMVEPAPLSVGAVSPKADVAVAVASLAGRRIRPLPVELREIPRPGQAVVLLGYPTALDGLLARLPDEEAAEVVVAAAADPSKVVAELARRGKIRPLATQGHLGDVLVDQLVYDAATTLGGSGGPLFSARGRVVGVNAAVMEGFAGANFGVPVRFAMDLLSR